MNRICAPIAAVMLAAAMLAAGCGKKDENKGKGDQPADKAAPEKTAAQGQPMPTDEAAAAREHRTTLEEEAAAMAKAPEGATGDPDTASKTAAADEEAKKLLAEFGPQVEAFMNSVVKAVDDGKGNCDAFAAPVTKIFTDSAGVLVKMKDTDKTEAAAIWKREHADLMRAFGSKMPAIFECAQKQPDLAKALQALPR